MGERRNGEVPAVAVTATPPAGRWQKKSEVVARQLIERIVAEGLDGGDRLEHEGELIERLGVSRATLREAFRLLEVTGILQVKPGREGGAIVQQPTGADFGRMVTLFFQVSRCTYRQLLHATIVIQPAIYRQAALAADDDDRARLRELWEEPEGRPRNDNDDVRSLTSLFRIVAEATHNPVLQLIVAAIGAVFQRHMDRLVVGVSHRREGARVGRLVVEAIDKGDGERAARLIRAHLEGWLEVAEREYPHILDAVVSWDQ
jgi:GntR family transcriptional regulator, transcriptional repressor for pyruvate dehydrogenase complex